MEAQIALVRLGDDNPFDFLSQLEVPFHYGSRYHFMN
jgi:hypothetical protein